MEVYLLQRKIKAKDATSNTDSFFALKSPNIDMTIEVQATFIEISQCKACDIFLF